MTRDVVLLPTRTHTVERDDEVVIAEGTVEAWAIRLRGEQLARLERVARRRAGEHGRSQPTREDYTLTICRAVYRGLVELDIRPIDDDGESP